MPCWHSGQRDPSPSSADPEVESWMDMVGLRSGGDVRGRVVTYAGYGHLKMAKAVGGLRCGSWMGTGRGRLVSRAPNHP